MKLPSTVTLALLATSVLPPAVSSTDCAPHNSQWPGEQSANFITLVSPTSHSWISGGADQWNTTCDVEQIPFFETATSNVPGTFNVTVDYRGGRNPGTRQTGDGCGRTNMGFNASGTMVSAEILIFDEDSDGFPCDDDYNSLMAHELGHLMGLDHSPFGPSCQGSIMYPVHLGGGRVSANDCIKADSQWFTDWESPDPCDSPNPPQGCDPYEQGPGSPIVIDLDRDFFRLTGPGNPVSFDIDNDGFLETMSWTAARTFDAFLCLDRNDNGRVDSGAELFGNYTPLIDGSTSENGYIPLAEFDLSAMGGNENGFIDPEDVIYNELQLWIDWNHNGISERREFLSLADAGITRIALRYRTSRRTDRHGNEFRYISRAWILVNGRERPTWTTDVFFVVE